MAWSGQRSGLVFWLQPAPVLRRSTFAWVLMSSEVAAFPFWLDMNALRIGFSRPLAAIGSSPDGHPPGSTRVLGGCCETISIDIVLDTCDDITIDILGDIIDDGIGAEGLGSGPGLGRGASLIEGRCRWHCFPCSRTNQNTATNS